LRSTALPKNDGEKKILLMFVANSESVCILLWGREAWRAWLLYAYDNEVNINEGFLFYSYSVIKNSTPIMLLTDILVVCFMTVLVIYLWILNSRYSYFEQRGIPTPPYSFFFGHYKTIWSTSLLTRQLQTWTRQFGSIYGLFEGTRPLYVVSDVEFLHEVLIKQFSSFHSRRLPHTKKKVI